MPQQNKIERFGLQGRALALFESGETTQAISGTLTAEIQGQYPGEQISQPTVSRWLKPYREGRRDDTAQVFQDHVQAEIKSDLEGVDNVKRFFYEQFANEGNSVKDRAAFAERYVRVIVDTTLRYVLGAGGGDGHDIHPVDLKKFKQALAHAGEGDDD